MKPLALAALSLGTLLLFTPVIAQQSAPHETRQHGQAVTPQTGMTDHDKMMMEMKASDAKLMMLADRMKSARGDEKITAMEDVVTQLVTNELRMHEHVRMMMQSGTMPQMMPKK